MIYTSPGAGANAKDIPSYNSWDSVVRRPSQARAPPGKSMESKKGKKPKKTADEIYKARVKNLEKARMAKSKK